MELKRYSTQELISLGKEIFNTYMSSSKTFYFMGDTVECTPMNPTPADMLYLKHKEIIEDNNNRIETYKEILNKCRDTKEFQLFQNDIKLLEEENKIYLNNNMENQKKRYKKTKDINYTQSIIRIPLDKKINSFYDDFYLEVLFYDDVCTLNGKYQEYRKLNNAEDRKQFIINNTEITRMSLCYIRNYKLLTLISILGEFKNQNVSPFGTLLLDKKFSDFSTLTLSDTNYINNNDLRQMFQSKIDMDKEPLKLLSSTDIRGNNYKIYRDENNYKLNYDNEKVYNYYIRYVCSSTGRVYYNQLVLNLLELSSYYKEDNYESYAKSWWNITHIGASIEGNNVIDC